MVKKELLEINKPSELSQVLFVDRNDRDNCDIVKITPGQIDMINCIYYHAREKIIINSVDLDHGGSTSLEIPLQVIAKDIGKYSDDRYDKIIDDLKTVSNINIIINSLGKNKDEDTMLLTRFILEMEVSKHRTNLHKKKVTLLLSNKLIKKFIDVKKYFAKMFLKIQYSLSSKYSKLLYEILKDYENINHLTLDLIMLTCLLNDLSFKEWSVFRINVLERAITEINEKSDIFVTYEPIKEKLEGKRKQVTKIKFFIEKQPEERLQELGLIQPSISTLPFYQKSKSKLDKLIKGGYQVIDEEMWIETDIKKNNEKYDAETRLDTWLNDTPQQNQNEIFKILANKIPCCEDLSVFIDKDYLIKGLFSQDILTKSASDTISVLNTVIDELQIQS